MSFSNGFGVRQRIWGTMMHSDRISRCLIQVGRIIGVGVILLAATSVFAEGERRNTHGIWTERNPVDGSSLRKVANLADDRATSALRKRFPELDIGEARGLTVPGMPKGAPGMEVPQPDHYQVLLLRQDGSTSVFAEH